MQRGRQSGVEKSGVQQYGKASPGAVRRLRIAAREQPRTAAAVPRSRSSQDVSMSSSRSCTDSRARAARTRALSATASAWSGTATGGSTTATLAVRRAARFVRRPSPWTVRLAVLISQGSAGSGTSLKRRQATRNTSAAASRAASAGSRRWQYRSTTGYVSRYISSYRCSASMLSTSSHGRSAPQRYRETRRVHRRGRADWTAARPVRGRGKCRSRCFCMSEVASSGRGNNRDYR